MKKVIYIFISLILVLAPVKVNAMISYEGYNCTSKQDLGDGTFYMTCYIVVNTDQDINHIEGKLILKNVNLESIKTNDDWINENGLALNVSFSSETSHKGNFTVAELIYTGNNSDVECEASFMPTSSTNDEPDNFVCAIVDDTYYGKDGTIVSKEVYFEQCCNYTCAVVDDEYYFDSNGNLVSYDEFIEDCSDTIVVENPQTGIDYGYIFLIFGILSIVIIVKIAKKNTKIYKI